MPSVAPNDLGFPYSPVTEEGTDPHTSVNGEPQMWTQATPKDLTKVNLAPCGEHSASRDMTYYKIRRISIIRPGLCLTLYYHDYKT